MSKQNEQKRPPSDAEVDTITDLVAGQLSPFAAWRLRRRIQASPTLARELREAEALQADLRSLQRENVTRPAPEWETGTGTAYRFSPQPTVWTFGRVSMNRRTVLAATAAACLLCITGGYAAVRHLYDPFLDLDAGNRVTWRVKEHNFRGEVRFYSPAGESQGSVGSDGFADSPPVATVEVAGEPFVVSGAGRHELRSGATGKTVGTVELVPETTAQREAWRRSHDREMGTEQRLHMSYGARDGYGQCVGYFGDSPNRVTWKLSGSNVRVLFFDQTSGKQVYSGTAFPVNDVIRAEMKQALSPEAYTATVAPGPVPGDPHFSWVTPDGKRHEFMTFRSYPLTLPDGTKLRAEIVPILQK